MAAVSATPPADDLQTRAEPDRAGRAFLVFADQREFPLDPESAPVTVGRHPSCDLLIEQDDQVSRQHARFERVEGHWELVDDGSSRNGTFVNEQRVRGRRRLRGGDTLRFGSTILTFRLQAGPAPAAAVDLSTTQRRVLAALCRSYRSTGLATEDAIAEELFLSAAAVKTHLRVLCAKLTVEQLPGSDAWARLAERALYTGLISEREL